MFGLVGVVFRLLDSYASRQEVFIHRSLSATLISSLDNILSISSSILIPPPDLAIPRIYSVLNLVLKEGVSSIPAVLILSTSETESTSIHINIIRPATGISTTIRIQNWKRFPISLKNKYGCGDYCCIFIVFTYF